MESNLFKVCVVCCYSYREETGVKSVKQSECSRILSKFCKELTEEDDGDETATIPLEGYSSTRKRKLKDNADHKSKVKQGRGRGYSKKGKDEGDNMTRSEKPVKNLSVCSDCLDMLGNVSKARTKAGKVEGRVRKLQQRILIELKELKEEMSLVYMEIKRVEDVMNSADAGCLQSLSESGRDTEVNEIIAFRENILRVSKSLSTYQTQLANKLLISSHSDKISAEAQLIKMEKEVQPDIPEPASASMQANFPEQLKIESIDDTIITEVEAIDLFVQPPIPATATMSTPCVFESDTNSAAIPPPEVWDSRDSNGDDIPNEEVSDVGNCSSNEEVSDVGNCSSNEDPEWVEPIIKKRKIKNSPKRKAGQKKRRKIAAAVKKSKKLPALPPDIDISGMSPWRREIVIRVYRRLKRYSQDKSGKDDNNDEEHFVRKFPMEYNPSTGLLSIGDINDLVINDEENCLQCSKCPFRVSDSKCDPAELRLFSHVLGAHMDVLNCKYCGQNFVSLRRYNVHQKIHTNPDSLTCKKCNKKLTSTNSFKAHQWTHMTPEEKAETVRLGKLKVKWNKDPNRRYQCPHCGKSYSSKSNLNMHEKAAHSGTKGHICPRCGKAFKLYTSYYGHVRESCLDDDHPKLECVICNANNPEKKRLFKHQGSLDEHIQRTHTKDAIEKNFVCEICLKRFSCRGTLRSHLKRHVDQPRNLLCRIGCGATFAHPSHWSRHNSICKGPGSRVRVRTSGKLSDSTSAEAKRKLMHLVRTVKTADS